MSSSTAGRQDTLRCPRCGANIAEPDAGHCTCCGSSLGLGGRTLGGARAPLRMSPALGQEGLRPNQRPDSPAQAAFRASPTGQGFQSVHQHPGYALWMQDAPSGLAHVLGMAGVAALGILFSVLALTGSIHASRGGDSGPVVALFVGVGLCIAGFGAWRLFSFYKAPRLNRAACVADERERTYRTKHGWRTRHYVTFEFEDGARDEFPVSSGLAAQVVRGDVGVAITRDSVLLAFHRAGRL